MATWANDLNVAFKGVSAAYESLGQLPAKTTVLLTCSLNAAPYNSAVVFGVAQLMGRFKPTANSSTAVVCMHSAAAACTQLPPPPPSIHRYALDLFCGRLAC